MVFNEDTRVKIPATIQFLRLGYDYQSLKNEEIDASTKIFKNRFKGSIERINKRRFSDEEINNLISEIDTYIKNNDLGKSFYYWLINPMDKIKLIDFDNIENNDFAVVNELVFGATREGSFRPDINILINGIPLAFLEVKKPNNEGGIQVEFNRMINERLKKPEHKKFFNMIQFISFSNNMEYELDDEIGDEVKAGSFYTTPNGFQTSFSFFREEEPKIEGFLNITDKEIKDVLKDNKYNPNEYDTPEFQENLDRNTPCNSFITSVFDKERFLYFLHYGIMYVDEKVTQKHIMRYPQFFATREIIKRLESGSKGGIIWHTQGSGKTALSAYSNRVIKDYYAKKNINTRFYFVVDRLSLLTQSSAEFTNRNFNVTNVNSRADFAKELNKTLPTSGNMSAIGDFTVVNIQKFDDKMPVAKNDYEANIQRVIFIDEAHRSYSSKGEFFKNLMLVDNDAIYIALTGTPLLSKKERSNLKFGDYIHKYFYDKSISDGYTLKIKKESIDTTARAEIKKNLELEDSEIDKKVVYESDDYINALGNFIEKDFENFRFENLDNTIGGMIVCSSNPQAKKVHKWFEDNSKFRTGLVITDESIPAQVNKEIQLEFKTTMTPDILVVHQMLTTGYDVKRLKKMYLLRNAKEHTLLQTISRVNRPYKSPNGKIYKYGYITDFVDIEEEYERTIGNYLEELEEDLKDGDEEGNSLKGLIIGPDEINEKYLKYQKLLDEIVDTSNLERFSKLLISFDKSKLLTIRKLLNSIKECYTEFLLSRAVEYVKQIDIDKNKKLQRELQNRINFVNLKGQAVNTLSVISNHEVVEIIYEFIKVKIEVMDLGKYHGDETVEGIIDKVKKIQKEIKENKNKNDIRIVKLDELFKKIFNMLEISDLSNLSEVDEELLKALEEIKKINEENERLAELYGGNYAFVKTYNDYINEFSDYEDSDIEQVLKLIYDNVKEVMDRNTLVLQGRDNFIVNVKKNTTTKLIKLKLWKKLNLKEWYTALLGDIYTNLQLYK
ncbi:type I restriction endonuclease [uncultured Clostridium sp.]|uniref:type I restriction endonuclease n=1 Tax=uncultured Clostridium sp. TaxID=59620 RepID=UPI002605AE94|nr:type I restriction endonuclease [uncultured Clostridium sp.]